MSKNTIERWDCYAFMVFYQAIVCAVEINTSGKLAWGSDKVHSPPAIKKHQLLLQGQVGLAVQALFVKAPILFPPF